MGLLKKPKDKLRLRLTPGAKYALQAAANSSGRSLAHFVMESALSRAHEILAARRDFSLSDEQWQRFIAALDAPPRPLPALHRLHAESGFYDGEEAEGPQS
jgi:uncharacterized protein (DUF1778 family)